MKTTIIVVYLLALGSFTYAQSAKERAWLYFEDVRAGRHAGMPKFDDADLTDVIPYLTDTTETVRIKARELLFSVASASTSAVIRSKVIEHLLAVTKQREVATGMVITMIKTFEKNAFTDSAKMHVRRLLEAEGPYLTEWMKIASFLELNDIDNHIRPYAQPGNQRSLRWSALLSLARIGDHAAAMEVLTRARKAGVNDDVVYKIFPDLIFTRQPSVISYMVDVLHQDGNHCLSADVERETAIPCGYRIMEQLAPVIEGLPLTLDKSGDLDVEDYASALNTAREWFRSHKGYSIQKERY